MKRVFPILEILQGFWSLLVGMKVTIGQFFKPQITVHYPHEALKMTPRYRGHIEMLKEEDTGLSVCTACKLCEKACPSFCITVEGGKVEGVKRRVANLYSLDFTKCSLCGACVEVCPVDAIRFSKDYNLAGFARNEYVMDLLANMKVKPAEKPAAAAAPAPAPAAPAAPAASVAAPTGGAS